MKTYNIPSVRTLPKRTKVICAKCGKLMDYEEGCVHPINKNGQELGRVSLCYSCIGKWGKFFEISSQKVKLNVNDFQKNWARTWTKFMSGQYDKVEVEFT